MNKKILAFNLVYYAVFIGLILLADQDPSSSIGYAYLIGFFCLVAAILLVVFLLRKSIRPRTRLDYVGIVMATPVLPAIVISIVQASQGIETRWGFRKDHYEYKVIRTEYQSGKKKFEYYRSASPPDSNQLWPGPWVKDSVWIYLSGTGDTIKKVTYHNGVVVKTVP